MSDAEARQKAEDHYYNALDLMADGKLEEAVVAYRESLAVDPSFTEAMHGLARALQDLQRYDEAITVAQPLSAVAHRDLLWRQDDADRLSRVLGIPVAGTSQSMAFSKVDRRDGPLCPPQKQWSVISDPWSVKTRQLLASDLLTTDHRPLLYAPLPAAAASPRMMVTSLPLPAPVNWAAAPRLAAISRKPMLPRMPTTSPGAPSA